MSTYKDRHRRSILKAISYRVLAAIATTTIVFVFTREPLLSIGIGLAEAVVKIIFYYVHERVWSSIPFGKDEHPLSSLPVKRALKEKDMATIKKKLQELGYLSED
ncbi:MAG: DUF2061 domain-containing protein [Planctomycetia bacterium]|nr:DUF2061 domain-containing protein [Planctomycetia bacterium]